jgi:hypothetical protein
VDRHNQRLPPEERYSQENQDLDHYLVGNEMAGPQHPTWERIGAVLPMVGHELARPFLSSSNKGIGPNGLFSGKQLSQVLNNVLGGDDEPVWISEGEGAGGAAAEPPVGLSGALRNLKMLYRGATGGQLPQEESDDFNPDKPWESVKANDLVQRSPAPKPESIPESDDVTGTLGNPTSDEAAAIADYLKRRNRGLAEKIGTAFLDD